MANKVKYGLSNVYYAKATIATNGSATYGTPERILGAVNLSLDAKGENNPFYADNINFYESTTNQGYEGDLEIAMLPDSFRADILGEETDANGVKLETSEVATTPFALLFQFEGDESGTRYAMYNCTATRPQIAGATKEEGVEVQTETLNLSCAPIYNASKDKYYVKGRVQNTSATSTTYADWFTSVYVSTN